MSDLQYDRRFAGTKKLYGNANFAKFEQLHALVIGVGGVGSWVAEGLARTGVGEITLIDMDLLVASNVNRQLPATNSNFGKSKIQAMAERIVEINPLIRLHLIDEFLSVNNIASLIPNKAKHQALQQQGKQLVVLDCVDDINAKIAIALHCRFNKLKLVVSGGAGGKTDPTCITISDLKDTYQDPLLAKLRQKLREKGINQQLKEKFGIKCVYSTQMPIIDKACQTGGLHCGGYGSAVAVTSVVGMVMVAEALKTVG
ncbi:UBA/THIF-type NAD/FAD binding protein [Moraxella macacae 0408225]|uniref:UBA/THIF-type NAD/FAD binding protein n=1 Tax=Moraxella macacae 0408225 TaxID=1230338 RepID=L2FB00_9GAMM|nr:tRNA threonylcarbamoyladenosine dehydratase [Moraxella macacae]ELA09613.1 UBA/THIF-type NAD/FAD binding protein [Moraxella macacae 0408225]